MLPGGLQEKRPHLPLLRFLRLTLRNQSDSSPILPSQITTLNQIADIKQCDLCVTGMMLLCTTAIFLIAFHIFVISYVNVDLSICEDVCEPELKGVEYAALKIY